MISKHATTGQQFDAYDEQQLASRMVECLLDLGEMETNPVLISLQDVKSIKPYQRYPEKPYYFGNKHWRAFYHCHDAANTRPGEHGHYHFFTRLDVNSEWSHVVALSMNNVGQPISLFTTNLWVTDGTWFDSNLFTQQIKNLYSINNENILTNWLSYALLIFQDEIRALLINRNKQINTLSSDSQEAFLMDRSIYTLSETDINLNEQLYKQFNLDHEH